LQLVKFVREEQPWLAGYGEIGSAWKRIAQLFCESLEVLSARGPDYRACQDRFSKLCERRKLLDKHPESRSGSSEDFNEVDQLLYVCIEEIEEHKHKSEEEKKKESDKQTARQATQERLRQHTRLTLSQRSVPPSSSHPRSIDSSSSSLSAEMQSGSDSKSEEERVGNGHAKKLKPSLQIQQKMLETQQKGIKLLSEQMERLVGEAKRQGDAADRGNDLFEQFLQR
jgi:hypothetical protein